MSQNFVQSSLVRRVYIAGCRVRARLTPASARPRVFLNSIPKAGTHLATTELSSLGFTSAGLHVDTIRVNLAAKHQEHRIDFELNLSAFNRYAAKVKSGQYFTAHLPWEQAMQRYLDENEIRTIFMVRDPRAVLVSSYHYILGLKRHHLHGVLKAMPDELSRYRALLRGCEDPVIPGLARLSEGFRHWESAPNVLTLRFEDLVGSRGGGNDDVRRNSLERVASFLGIPMPAAKEAKSTVPVRTATLRKGRIDSWREELPASILEEIKIDFASACADLGYPLD